MYKYLCAITLGILIYIIWNHINGFSVGANIGEYYLVGYKNRDNTLQDYQLIIGDTLDSYLIKLFNTPNNPNNPGLRLPDMVPFAIYGYMAIDWNNLLTNGIINVIDQDEQVDLTQSGGRTQEVVLSNIRELINNHYGLTPIQLREFVDRPNLNYAMHQLLINNIFSEFDYQPELPLQDQLAGWRARAAAECAAAAEPIDPTIAHIDLAIIEEDIQGEDDEFYIFTNDDRASGDESKVAHFSRLPCKLKVRDGMPLKYVSMIESGTYGIVYKYSSHYSKEIGESQYVTIGVKVYNSDPHELDISGQNDPEIRIIRDMNVTAEDMGLNMCDIVDARILSVGTSVDKGVKNICIMEYMDGDVLDLIELDEDISVEVKKKLVRTMAVSFKCISDAEYCYTDLKPANILYKQTGPSEYIFTLGDIGSIVLKNPSKYNTSTYPIPEYEFRMTDHNNTDDTMIWNLGALISTLYPRPDNIDLLLKWDYIRPIVNKQESLRNLGLPYKTQEVMLNEYYTTTIRDTVISYLHARIIDGPLMEIVRGTLTRPGDRISLDRIIQLLE